MRPDGPVKRPADPIFVSVAICTWNRCQLLRATLEQMTRLYVPPDVEWELLVVNNNCTDGTSDVLTEFSDRLPLTQILETKQGLSHARNAAIANANGSYIIWTDDDVLVSESWLAEYVASFHRWPEAGVFGAPIHPWFEGTPPDWLNRVLPRVQNAFATRNLGSQEMALGPETDRLPFGANMAFKSQLQRRFPYDPALGRRPGSWLGGEELAVAKAMLEIGVPGRWVPSAPVRHFIPKERQTLRYLHGYYAGYGRSLALAEGGEGGPAILLERPRWLWRAVVEKGAVFGIRRAFSPPEVWIEALIAYSIAWGQFVGAASPPG
jgi:glucosyl-dolichyl phosphate glucuronosyltransferase